MSDFTTTYSTFIPEIWSKKLNQMLEKNCVMMQCVNKNWEGEISQQGDTVKIITPAVFGDHRGFFEETYSDRDFKAAGIDFNFIQDNQSLSTQAGVLRGLHF